ncbi:carbohydrate ABC transporter permease [Jingyaoa shaoxingensis]|uniref:Sugar ABC transporter permease n=1 Tax=Jingyaoa shaoxingensis TaxID=2763671 RepID=A0ABR7NAL4_9FIRM|nr:sugar ABC transporter permease [Jingyaoa shaoxingensis]MBC8572758.1 sugar ABC transporter permease [Jingyaoa shaoxingensis]
MAKWVNKNIKWIFTAPTIIFILLCVTYPILYTLQLSFCEWGMSANIPKKFVGLQNYIEIFSDSRFWDAFWRTINYTLIAVAIETILGVAIALLLGKITRHTGIIRTVFLLPMVATPVAVGMVWKLIYDPTIGLANLILRKVGLPTSAWLGSSDTVFSSLIIIDIWQWTPMVMLMVLAGISGLGADVFESAKVDGANEMQLITRIQLPLLAPTILMAILLRVIDALKTFDIIYSTTTGGPGYSSENLNILSYRNAFEYFYMGKASALLIVFFIVVLVVAILYMLLKARIERRYES